jgi:hypothetical protein
MRAVGGQDAVGPLPKTRADLDSSQNRRSVGAFAEFIATSTCRVTFIQIILYS